MTKKLISLVRQLYATKNKLRQLNPNWTFTLDGNLIGDIGEVLACYHFDLKPLSKGEKTHDASTRAGKIKMVQIKTTQRENVGLGLRKRDFEHLIVVKIHNDGSYKFIYNGPGNIVWNNTKSQSISVTKLKRLQSTVKLSNSLPMKTNTPLEKQT